MDLAVPDQSQRGPNLATMEHVSPKARLPVIDPELKQRFFYARLFYQNQLGRNVTLKELAAIITWHLGNGPIHFTTVSDWFARGARPQHERMEAFCEVTGVDPGWMSHGSKSLAPGPPTVADHIRGVSKPDSTADRHD